MSGVDPELESFASFFPALDLSKAGLADTRKLVASFTPTPLDPAPQERWVPSFFDKAHKIRILVYMPETPKPCPVMIQFHGGGFVLGAAEDSHYHNQLISSKSGIAVIAVDYRLAPEYPYPAAIEDGYSVVNWLVSHADEIGVDADKLIISGESAGGGIAASLAQYMTNETHIAIASLQLIYPMLDPRTGQNGEAQTYVWTPENNRLAWKMYAPKGIQDLRSFLPIASGNTGNFPATSIYVGTEDLFYKENLRFGETLKDTNIQSQIFSYNGGVHAFPMAIGTEISNRFWDDYLTNISGHIS